GRSRTQSERSLSTGPVHDCLVILDASSLSRPFDLILTIFQIHSAVRCPGRWHSLHRNRTVFRRLHGELDPVASSLVVRIHCCYNHFRRAPALLARSRASSPLGRRSWG